MAASILARAASLLYGAGARLHRRTARWRRRKTVQPSCAVLSVGALTVGGAGKTPVAAAFACALRERGHRVVLASRGYKGQNPAPVSVVSDGQNVHSSVFRSGDESMILASHAPGVPVLVGRDRRIVGHHAVSVFGAEILVLDDGFQHHRLVRDLDVVCIDATAGIGNGRVLPAGPLREPASALRDADWLCLVDGPARSERHPSVGRVLDDFSSRGGRVVRASRRVSQLARLDGSRSEDPKGLAGRHVGMLAGIARPDSLRLTLQELGATICAERVFPDHHTYRASDLANLEAEAAVWVTSEKDALKILPRWTSAVELGVLRIDAEFDDAPELIRAVEAALRRG